MFRHHQESLSAQRPSRNADVSEYSEQSAAETSGFHDSLLGFGSILKQLAADKGLANYDQTDPIQTLLKETVNANKDFLKSIDEDVYAIPGLGSTLGPSKLSTGICVIRIVLILVIQLSMRSSVSLTRFWMPWKT